MEEKEENKVKFDGNPPKLNQEEPHSSPSVMALSNLRCPSPPPILHSTNTSKTGSPSPMGTNIAGNLLFKKDASYLKKSPAIPSSNGPTFGTNNSLPGVSAPALRSISPTSHLTESLDENKNNSNGNGGSSNNMPHTHFFVDDKRSRSRSSSVNERSIAEALEPIVKKEANSNIDPRLPQDDGKLHILIGICGSISTNKIRLIISKLEEIYKNDKISIQIILTKSAEFFISRGEFATNVQIWRDKDEWQTWGARTDPVLHIELRRWADILIIAPLTANTLSKIALGLCDNLLTNVVRAWNTQYPILLAPAMVSYAYNSAATKRHLKLIKEEMPWIEVLKPVEKVVGSYGDIGMGGMMDWNEIVNKVVLKLGGYPEEEDEDDEDDDTKIEKDEGEEEEEEEERREDGKQDDHNEETKELIRGMRKVTVAEEDVLKRKNSA